MKTFEPTQRQEQGIDLAASKKTHILFYGGSRCVSGDTILDEHSKTIEELAVIGWPIKVKTTRGDQIVEAPFLKGQCELLEVTLSNGKSIKVTPDHRFWNGKNWVKAETLSIGSSLACTYSQTLQGSSSVPFLSRLLSNVQRWKRKALNLKYRCLTYLRQYGLQPPLSPVCALNAYALLYGGQGHSRYCQNPSYPFLLSPLSNTHTDYQYTPASANSRCGHGYNHLSSRGDFPLYCHGEPLPGSYYEQTSLPSQGLHLINRLFVGRFFLPLSISKVLDNLLYRCARFFYLSYDIPFFGGYELSRVLNITKTAKETYYTLQVPVTEQYFANGILHHNSGKTLLHVRNMVIRAIKAPKSRHCILRYRFNHVKQSVVYDTFPKVMELCFKGVKYRIDKSDWFAEFENGSQIWFGGLDDKERTEKILGNEYCTIFLNECSQISNSSRELVRTRLAQVCHQQVGEVKKQLSLKMYYDENPPKKGHWSYRIFFEGVDPETKRPLSDKDDFEYLKMSPEDNLANLSKKYIESLKSLSPRMRKRFYEGEFADDNPNQLFNEMSVESNRIIDEELPDFQRVIVGVDPSGASDDEAENNDDIGITVGALGVDGRAYLLEDCTINQGPGTWGQVAVNAYERHKADRIVAEKNFGGEMVRFVIQSAKRDVPFKFVTATRGKVIRAEPISALYDQDKVVHVGYFQDLEEELYGFSTSGYTGERSPNRADAWIWVLTELFGGIVEEKKDKAEPLKHMMANRFSW